MSPRVVRGLALALLRAAAWLVPWHERQRWHAQWRADVWHRWQVLEERRVLNHRTIGALLGRVLGAVRHAAWLRFHRGGHDMWIHDLRQAARGLRGHPGFTVVAILTLALGIGANAVIFSWVEAIVLNPLPGVHDPGTLAALHGTSNGREDLSLSYPNYVDLRDQSLPGIADIAVFSTGALGWRTSNGVERVWGQLVSGNLFPVLGVRAARGRLLTPDDDRRPDGDPVAVVSHDFWQRRLGGRDDVVGATLVLNERAFTIVGVADPAFHGTQPLIALDVFVPMTMQTTFLAGDRRAARGSGWLQSLARRTPGASAATAQASLDVAARQLALAHPEVNEGRGLRLFSLWRQPTGGTRQMLPVLGVLGGLVATLLLVVCANMASLLLARTTGRARELAVRRSVGAGGWDIVRLLLTESVVLAAIAGVFAAALSRWSGDLLAAFIPPLPLPISVQAGLNVRVLLFAAVASVGAGLLLGVLPALQARRGDLLGPLKEGGGAIGARGRSRARQGLIVAQVALALVLLVSGGLFVRSLNGAREVDPGFAARDGLVGALDLLPRGYGDSEGRRVYRQVVDALRAIPGVESAAMGQRLPLTVTESSDRGIAVEGYTPSPGEEMTAYYASVSPGYFATLQMPLVDGRDFGPGDDDAAPLRMVVNETMARRFWPGRSSLGGRVKVGDRWADVIGVVRDAKYASLTETTPPFYYLSVDQAYRPAMRLVVRTAGEADALVPLVRQAVASVDPALPLFDVQTLRQHLAFSYFLFEMAATLLSGVGVVAMLLAALGLYGVVAQHVSQRTREIGVRISLGATAADVRRLVVWQGLVLTGIGVALGLAAALAVTPLFASQLIGVGAFDPASYAGMALLLLSVATLACYLPARRATRIDPVEALRAD